MSTITIKDFAKQIGIEPERLVKQLNDAGVSGKTVKDSLRDEEKRTLLEFLRGGSSTDTPAAEVGATRGKITLKKKTSSEIQQTTKTGVARTVQVQTKKRRTFVKREVLEQEEAERKQAQAEAEAAAKAAAEQAAEQARFCLLYTSPSPRDLSTSRMPSSA